MWRLEGVLCVYGVFVHLCVSGMWMSVCVESVCVCRTKG